jgi:hypothetical protein
MVVFLQPNIFWHMIVKALNLPKNQLNEWSMTHIPPYWQHAIPQRQWKEQLLLGEDNFLSEEIAQ